MHVNTKNHSTPVNDLASHVDQPPHAILYKVSMFPPAVIISITHDPPDRYITGNIASNFPSFGPGHLKKSLVSDDIILLVYKHHVTNAKEKKRIK